MSSAKDKYDMCLRITSKALEDLIVKKNTALAKEYLKFTNSYVSDSKHYAEKEEYETALEAVAYAHGFIDAGVLAGLFEIKDYHLRRVE